MKTIHLTALGAALSLVGGHCLFQTPAGTDAGLVLFMIAGVFIGLFLAEILDRIEARLPQNPDSHPKPENLK
jgi:hypothetical protein